MKKKLLSNWIEINNRDFQLEDLFNKTLLARVYWYNTYRWTWVIYGSNMYGTRNTSVEAQERVEVNLAKQGWRRSEALINLL